MTLSDYLATFTSDEAMDIIMRLDHRYVLQKAVEQLSYSFGSGSKISFLAIDALGYSRPTSEMDSVEKYMDGLVIFPTVDDKPIADLHFILSEIMSIIKSNKRDKLISNVLG